jgi:tRNA(Arg) A34 adenosine deaminase TadA
MAAWPEVRVSPPAWVAELALGDGVYSGDEDRMRFAIAIARENVARGTGGPFGAAIFEEASGRLVGVGMNSVVRLNNATLHGEMVAFMAAQARPGTWTLGGDGLPAHVLATSCEPCAMCLGAILWSGVSRVICGAGRDDATRLGFEEGPVFAESYRYLEDRGVKFSRDVLRAEAVAVMEQYRNQGGVVYNG